MKRTVKTCFAAILAAAIAAVPAASMALTAYAATTTLPAVTNVKLVKKTGDLKVTIPSGVSGSFQVKAYEMLQLVINKDSTFPEDGLMTNDADSQNLYVVTDNFKGFFSAARTAYTAEGSTLPDANTLYLTFSSGKLQIGTESPSGVENEDYIVIDNTVKSTGHKGKLEKEFFEADLVSRIITSDPLAGETEASAARLLSDWASRYARANALEPDQTAAADGNKFTFKDLIYGYYVIIANDDSTDNDKTVVNQSILNVPLTTSASLKATPITIDKSVDSLVDANKNNNGDADLKNTASARIDDDADNGTKYDRITANIGDVLQYKVESHIPSYTSYVFTDASKLLAINVALDETNFDTKISEKFVFTFRDKMINQDFIPVDSTVSGVEVKGLKAEVYNAAGTEVEKTFVTRKIGNNLYLVDSTINNPAAADAVASLWETDYTTATKSDFFAINFDIAKLKAQSLDGKNILFTYNAELMGEADNSTTENDAKFTYSNDPYDASTNDTIQDKNKVYTYDMKIDKVFSDGATDLYDKVTFKLFTDADKTHSVAFTGSNGVFVRADSNDQSTGDVLNLDAQGKLSLHGLGEGTYYLAEQTNTDLTSKGYNTVNTITVVVTAKDGDALVDQTNFGLFAEDQTKCTALLDEVYLTLSQQENNKYGIEFEVLNQKGFTLPLTGEFGNWMLAIGGILLVAVGGTVIVLANRKKKTGSASDED